MSASGSNHTENEQEQENKVLTTDELAAVYSCVSFEPIEPFKKKIAKKFNTSFDTMPASLKRRIKRLKQLQYETFLIDTQYKEELHALEAKYYKLRRIYYHLRSGIISGKYIPKDEECVREIDDEKKASDDLKSKVPVTEVEDQKMDVDKGPEAQITEVVDEKMIVDEKSEAQTTEVKDECKVDTKLKSILKVRKTEKKEREHTERDVKFSGIPGFWLKVFLSCPILEDMIDKCDVPILIQLHDVTVKYLERNPMGFVLEFHFARNKYFSNSVLTKEYHMRSVIKKSDLDEYKGPQIYRTRGCVIDWKEDRNVTIKKSRKKVKGNDGKVMRVSKIVQVESFFNFFSPPIVQENTSMSEDIEVLLTMHFEVGNYIKDRLIPKAILYFTGETFKYEEEAAEKDDENLKAHLTREKSTDACQCPQRILANATNVPNT